MLFVGDVLQLPPVTGNPVFSKLTNKIITATLGCMTAITSGKKLLCMMS